MCPWTKGYNAMTTTPRSAWYRSHVFFYLYRHIPLNELSNKIRKYYSVRMSQTNCWICLILLEIFPCFECFILSLILEWWLGQYRPGSTGLEFQDQTKPRPGAPRPQFFLHFFSFFLFFNRKRPLLEFYK